MELVSVLFYDLPKRKTLKALRVVLLILLSLVLEGCFHVRRCRALFPKKSFFSLQNTFAHQIFAVSDVIDF